MAVDERRASLVEAALPLLIERGAAASTREIAAAAGVAEGTIFRVFDTKEDLVAACVDHAVDTSRLRRELGLVDRSQPLEDRLVSAVTVVQTHTRRVISLMIALHASGLTTRRHDTDETQRLEAHERQRREVDEDLRDLVGEDVALLRLPVQRMLDALRALTFASVHPLMGGGPAAPRDIVDVVLHGAVRRDAPKPEVAPPVGGVTGADPSGVDQPRTTGGTPC